MALSDCIKCWDTPCSCGFEGYVVVRAPNAFQERMRELSIQEYQAIQEKLSAELRTLLCKPKVRQDTRIRRMLSTNELNSCIAAGLNNPLVAKDNLVLSEVIYGAIQELASGKEVSLGLSTYPNFKQGVVEHLQYLQQVDGALTTFFFGCEIRQQMKLLVDAGYAKGDRLTLPGRKLLCEWILPRDQPEIALDPETFRPCLDDNGRQPVA